MANALGFIFDAAGVIIPLALSETSKPQAPSEAQTSIQIILGQGSSTAGGTVPHIALWDDGKCRYVVFFNILLTHD